MRARGLILAVAAVATLAAPPAAADSFKDIRRAVEREIGGSRVYVPLMGLARWYVRANAPEGVHDIQLAIYENTRVTGSGPVEDIFRRHLGDEWRAFVRVHSAKQREEVVIYAREGKSGRTIDLLIFAGEPSETVLLMTTLDVERFVAGLGEPAGFAVR